MWLSMGPLPWSDHNWPGWPVFSIHKGKLLSGTNQKGGWVTVGQSPTPLLGLQPHYIGLAMSPAAHWDLFWEWESLLAVAQHGAESKLVFFFHSLCLQVQECKQTMYRWPTLCWDPPPLTWLNHGLAGLPLCEFVCSLLQIFGAAFVIFAFLDFNLEVWFVTTPHHISCILWSCKTCPVVCCLW